MSLNRVIRVVTMATYLYPSEKGTHEPPSILVNPQKNEAEALKASGFGAAWGVGGAQGLHRGQV